MPLLLSVLIAVPRFYPAILNGTGLLMPKDEQILLHSKTFSAPCASLRARTTLAHPAAPTWCTCCASENIPFTISLKVIGQRSKSQKNCQRPFTQINFIGTQLFVTEGFVKNYRYRALESPKHIRLLNLAQGDHTDPLKCSIEHVDLDSNPIFFAISFVWYVVKVLKYILGTNWRGDFPIRLVYQRNRRDYHSTHKEPR